MTMKRKGVWTTAYASPWVVLGTTAILAVAVFTLFAINSNREKRYMSRILREKGAALIRAFEAGSRAGMSGHMGAGSRLQNLLEETADQADIMYIAVVDRNGLILAHNDTDLLGTQFLSPGLMAELDPGQAEQWRIFEERDKGVRSFTVYRTFLPRMGAGGGGGGGGGGQHGPGKRNRGNASDFFCSDLCDPEGKPVALSGMNLAIFVGMNPEPFELAMAQDRRNSLLIAAVLVVLGFGGVVSLFWAQSYRRNRRLLLDARAISTEVVARLPVGLIVTDRKHRLALLNMAAEGLTGVRHRGAVGKDPALFLPSGLLPLIDPDSVRVVVEQEMECSFGEGEPLPLAVSAAPIATEENEYVGHVLILRDLRDIRHLQREVRRKEKLAAVGDLAAGLAHEIRNPLSSIRGYAAYFKGKFPEQSDERGSAEVLVREADRLNRVVSQLLEFARPAEPALRPVDLEQTLAHSLKLAHADALNKGVNVELDVAPGLEQVVLDPDRITQALLNLYLNGIQAMEKGGSLRVSARVADDGRLCIEVADQGKGMAPEELARVFDPYYTTRDSGTGLGLPIAHKIVEAHGGEIRVQSEPGRGSVFRLLLPLKSSPEGGR